MKSSTKQWLPALLLGLLIFALAACGPAQPPEDGEPAAETAPETTGSEETAVTPEPVEEPDTAVVAPPAGDVEVTILQEGEGDTPQVGQLVTLNYQVSLDDGTVIDSSEQTGQPVQFMLGQNMVIPGVEEGVLQMNLGSVAEIIIPPDQAYGEQGVPGIIPPNSTLTFEMELLEIEDGPPPPPESPTSVDAGDYTTTDSGLQYFDLAEGDGDIVEPGQTVSVHYTGWLEDGTMFDSSLTRGVPFPFTVGAGQVIPGWDEGVTGMAVGGVRQLVIPSDLAYGDAGAGGIIPPGATLIFEVEVLSTSVTE